MQVYILKRNNQQSGPYTAQQLHGMGLLPTDQVRMAGSDIGWSFVDEIDELAPFVVSSSIVTPQGLVSKKDILREPPISGPDPAHPAAVSPDSPITTPWSKIRVDEGTGEKNKDLRPQMPSDPSRNIPASAPEDKARPDGKFDGGDKNVIDVIVTDDHWIFRDGVKNSLSGRKDINIVGEAENGQQLLNLLKHRKADVILLDITMPTMDGLSALKALRREDKQTKVIVLSMHEGRSMVSSMMEAGANGYLIKTADPESIYRAIRACHEKGFYFTELTNVAILEGLRQGTPTVQPLEKMDRPETRPIHERPSHDDFNGGKILEKLAEARKLEVKENSRTRLQAGLMVMASVLCLIAVIRGGFWLKEHPEWLRLNTLAPDKQENVNIQEPGQDNYSPAKVIPSQSPSIVIEDRTNAGSGNTISIEPTVTNTESGQAVTATPTIPATDPNVAKQKVLLEKRKSDKRTRDSLLKAQQAAALAKPATGPTTSIEPNNAQTEPVAPMPKKVDPAQVLGQVSARANDYKVGVFGGLSRIEITVRNASAVALDDVAVDVSYISASDNVIQTKTVHTGPLSGSSSQVVTAPSSNRGAKIECRVTQVKVKE